MRIKVDCIQNYRLLVDRQLRQSVGVARRKRPRASTLHFIARRFYDNFALLLFCQQVRAPPLSTTYPLCVTHSFIPLVVTVGSLCSCSILFFLLFIFALQLCRYLPLWPFFVALFNRSFFFRAVLHSLLAFHCCGQP